MSLVLASHICFVCLTHSDNEEDHMSRNGRQDTLEFKDEEETVTTKSIQITQATETTTTTTRKRSGAASSKTLDLGAAAHYTGDKSPEEKVLTKTSHLFKMRFIFFLFFNLHFTLYSTRTYIISLYSCL